MKLLFVYNADSGLAAALFDSAHKALSPSTYQCNLCALTYGLAGPKKQWNEFLKSLPQKPVFLHRDQFLKNHPDHADTALPAVFRMSGSKNKEQLTLLAAGTDIQKIESLDDLMNLLK